MVSGGMAVCLVSEWSEVTGRRSSITWWGAKTLGCRVGQWYGTGGVTGSGGGNSLCRGTVRGEGVG